MKSVGEAMALGRTFQESFQKAVRSLELGYSGWGCANVKELDWDWEQLKYNLRVPNPDRIHAIYAVMKKGMTIDEIHELSFVDKWFLTQLRQLVDFEQFILAHKLSDLSKDDFYELKKRGFSDKQIAFATNQRTKKFVLQGCLLGFPQFISVSIHVLQNLKLILLTCIHLMTLSVNRLPHRRKKF